MPTTVLGRPSTHTTGEAMTGPSWRVWAARDPRMTSSSDREVRGRGELTVNRDSGRVCDALPTSWSEAPPGADGRAVTSTDGCVARTATSRTPARPRSRSEDCAERACSARFALVVDAARATSWLRCESKTSDTWNLAVVDRPVVAVASATARATQAMRAADRARLARSPCQTSPRASRTRRREGRPRIGSGRSSR